MRSWLVLLAFLAMAGAGYGARIAGATLRRGPAAMGRLRKRVAWAVVSTAPFVLAVFGIANAGCNTLLGNGDYVLANDASAPPLTVADAAIDGRGPSDGADAMTPPRDAAADAPTGREEAGADAATCSDPCTMGATQCAAGGSVQTCEVQSSGCTAWVTSETCGAHQSCTVSDGAAACTCTASICTQGGTVCQDGQTVATCATDSDSCLYVESTSACTPPMSCSGAAPTAACSSTCTSSCTTGQTSCVSGALATCTLGTNGCYAYGTPAACGTNQTCGGTAGSASCACNQSAVCGKTAGPTCASASTLATCSQDTQGCVFESATTPCTTGACSGAAGGASCCSNACTAGTTQCTTSGVETCQTQANGCTAWVLTTTCGPHETCTVGSGAATCTCNPSVCTQAGAVCQNSQTVDNCATDANLCLYVASTQPCSAPEVCSGNSPSAGCALTCTSSCTAGQMSCIAGDLATCVLGSNGCYSYGPGVACATNEVCSGPSGTAGCTCASGTLDCNGSCESASPSNSCGTLCATSCASPAAGTGSAVCSGSTCGIMCNTGLTPCPNSTCVNTTDDPNNCGACGNVCTESGFQCVDSQCTCGPSTPNGYSCTRPGDVAGVCWSGTCVLAAFSTGCTEASDCVPGGCVGSYCIGTVDTAGQVTCSEGNVEVVCPTSVGCNYIDTGTGGIACGTGNSGEANIFCDGPNDCPLDWDCCAGPDSADQSCVMQPQPGVIGSGCASLDPSAFGPQAAVVCDPANPTSSCPANQSCSGSPMEPSGFTCE